MTTAPTDQKQDSPPNLTTPGDDAIPKDKRNHPTKGRRYRVLGKGEGDHCIYEITPDGGPLPSGCLMPIPEVPRFESMAEAKRWIKGSSGDLLAGKQIMIFQVGDIGNIRVVPKPMVDIEWKPKVQVSGPETENA